MGVRDDFISRFSVWPEVQPYLDLLVTTDEMQMVVAMAGEVFEVDDLVERAGISAARARRLVVEAYAKNLLNRVEHDGASYDSDRYQEAEFEALLDHFVKLGDWHALPEAVRRQIDHHFLESFIEKHRENVERRMAGLPVESSLPNDAMLLLAEAVQMIDAAELIAVQPCDCRRLGERCSRPVAACLLLNDAARDLLDRGHGRPLSRKEAIDLLHRLDRQGLMHTADPDWKQNGAFYICNCCGCDCYPLRAAAALGSKGVWPQVRYLAAHDLQSCRSCGACVNRCHYQAFERTDETVLVDGKSRQRVSFVAERCWGCGLCANTCPEHAISMQALAAWQRV